MTTLLSFNSCEKIVTGYDLAPIPLGTGSSGNKFTCVREIDMAASGKEGSVLDCPICLEKLRNPKYLPCLHTFCELCIQSFIDSSITDCVQKKKTISFDCPVCRLVIPSPAKKISAKAWAEQLPINHQLLATSESYQKQTEVFCDSCRQNSEHVIATIRCQQCRENLCKACFKFIHERVKAFGLHIFVDLRSTDGEIDTTIDPGNCLVHTDKPIEVYCFDHGNLGCIYCLTTVHKVCKTVLSLDEIDEKDLENFSESVINETRQMRDLTSCNILDTKKNMADLNQENDELLKNVAKNIQDIKQRLDYLHLKFQNSLQTTYEKETSDLSFVLKTLEDFDTSLAQNENIASTFMERGTKKQIFIAMEKIKLRLSDHLERMTTNTDDFKRFKRSKIKWTYINVVESLNGLTKLGNLECIIERFDFITPIKKHFNAMEKDGSLREKGNIYDMPNTQK